MRYPYRRRRDRSIRRAWRTAAQSGVGSASREIVLPSERERLQLAEAAAQCSQLVTTGGHSRLIGALAVSGFVVPARAELTALAYQPTGCPDPDRSSALGVAPQARGRPSPSRRKPPPGSLRRSEPTVRAARGVPVECSTPTETTEPTAATEPTEPATAEARPKRQPIEPATVSPLGR